MKLNKLELLFFYHVPPPSLKSALTEFMYEKSRLGKMSPMIDTFVTVPAFDKPFCRFYRESGYVIYDCVTYLAMNCVTVKQ